MTSVGANRRQLNIAIIGPARFPMAPPYAGGMEMHTATLAHGLRRRGHRVTVYAAATPGDPTVRAMLAVPSPRAGRVDVLTDAAAIDGEIQSYLEAMLDLAGRNHDVVHINAVHHVAFAGRALTNGLVTGTLHTPPAPALIDALRSGSPMPLAAVSTTMAAAWAAVDVPAHTIVNGVDTTVWRPGPGGPGAIWTGRIVPEKAPHLAIAAARRAGISLTLYGPSHDTDYFRDAIAPELDDTIVYGGHLDPPDLANAVGHAAVSIVTPVWDEPFGLVVAESLACGTPVAAFARGALPDLIDVTTGALARPDDVDDLAAAITRARRCHRRVCRSAAERCYSADRMVAAYERWFAGLLNERHDTPAAS